MTEAKNYSAVIMDAIQSTGETVNSRELLDALMVITSMVLLGTNDQWSDAGLRHLATAYGDGVASTLTSMAKLKRDGGDLPFQRGGTKH